MNNWDLSDAINNCSVMKNTLHSALVILANYAKTQDVMNIMRAWAMFYDFEWRLDEVKMILENYVKENEK